MNLIFFQANGLSLLIPLGNFLINLIRLLLELLKKLRSRKDKIPDIRFWCFMSEAVQVRLGCLSYEKALLFFYKSIIFFVINRLLYRLRQLLNSHWETLDERFSTVFPSAISQLKANSRDIGSILEKHPTNRLKCSDIANKTGTALFFVVVSQQQGCFVTLFSPYLAKWSEK